MVRELTTIPGENKLPVEMVGEYSWSRKTLLLPVYVKQE